MTRAREWAAVAALLACTFAGAAWGAAGLAVRRWLDTAELQAIAENTTAVTRHADRTLAAADALIGAGQTFTAHEDTALTATTGKLGAAVDQLNQKVLPAATGVLTEARATVGSAGDAARELRAAIADARADETRIAAAATDDLAATGFTLADLRKVFQGLAALEANPDLVAALRNLNLTTAEFQGVLADLRAPQHPTRFIRAVSILLSLLKMGAFGRQALGQ